MDPVIHRGTKRKRKGGAEDDLGARVDGKLFHTMKEIRQAAKKAKTFDTQKLVKKLKGLRQKNSSDLLISDLEAQLVSLKALDVEPLANLALKTKLHKDHILASNEHIQRATSSYLSANAVVSPEPGTAEAKVHSRLLSSKVLASEISSAVDYLRKVLEPLSKKEAEGDPDKAVAYDAADSDDDTEENVVSIVPNPRKPAKVIAKSPTEAGEEEEGESGIEGVAEDDHDSWESGSVDSRGAADAGWESGTVDDSDAEEAEDDVEIGSEDNSSSSPRPAKKKMVKVMPKESTFLPSLAVGFTRGDSDTDWSDSEAKVADSTEKKNRRGQRARRAIWEKKFGKGANHVKKQQEVMGPRGRPRPFDGKNATQPLGRARPWGPAKESPGGKRQPPEMRPTHNRGHTNSFPSRESRPAGGQAPTHRGGVSRSATNPAAVPQEDRPLHPSWEAKRRQKEKQHASILPSTGKKIKF